jgi:hypothetical protein
MRPYLVTARTASGAEQFTHFAESSGRAAEDVAGMYEEPCSVTVMPGAR